MYISVVSLYHIDLHCIYCIYIHCLRSVAPSFTLHKYFTWSSLRIWCTISWCPSTSSPWSWLFNSLNVSIPVRSISMWSPLRPFSGIRAFIVVSSVRKQHWPASGECTWQVSPGTWLDCDGMNTHSQTNTQNSFLSYRPSWSVSLLTC